MENLETFLAKHIDPSISPGNDFFNYVNGTWLKNTPIPDDQVKWGSFYELADDNMQKLRTIIESIDPAQATSGSTEQKIKYLYDDMMNEAKIEEDGLAPLQPLLSAIQKVETPAELSTLIGSLETWGVGTPIGLVIEEDEKKSEDKAIHLYQSGLGLPDREYYFKEEKEFANIRAMYKDHIKNMFVLVGDNVSIAQTKAEQIFNFENDLAKVHMTKEDTRDIDKVYHRFAFKELQTQFPGFEWNMYWNGIELAPKEEDTLIVCQPEVMRFIGTLCSPEKIPVWKDYLIFHALSSYSSYLPKKFYEESFDFYSRKLNGVKEPKPRWKRAVRVVDGVLGFALGEIFVEKYFGKDAQQMMKEMTTNLQLVFKDRIMALSWMSEETKKKAIIKLEHFRNKIGFPPVSRDYSTYIAAPGVLIENIHQAALFNLRFYLSKLGKPIDPDEWDYPPQIVNAFFYPTKNELFFPAGILQAPFFDVRAPLAWNYGAIGSIIGHELTHGFDDQGARFDEKGNVVNWWTKEDEERFKEKTQAIVTQYDSYEPLPGLHINGSLTQGENIADFGGIVISYEAYKQTVEYKNSGDKKIAGFTLPQLFFIALAVAEKGKTRDEALRTQLMTDPHSPGKYRVNGPLVHVDPFHEAFETKEGDTLYRKPEDRVAIW